jgi:hypothetical protein
MVSEPFTIIKETDRYTAYITVLNFDKEKHQEQFARLYAELINKERRLVEKIEE